MVTRSLVDAVAAAVRRDPGQPYLTFYDDATGERVELSWTTFDNWVSKIANLFTDEVGTAPGEAVSVELPTHWLGPVVVLGAWSAGLVLSPAGQDDRAVAVRVVGPDAVASHDAEASPGHGETVIACSLRPLGGRFLGPLPSGWLDFAVEVPPQPDALMQPQPLTPADLAVAAGSRPAITHGELYASGEESAADFGLATGGRLATDLNPVDAGLVQALAATIAVAGSLVIVVNASAQRRAELADQERVTCQLWSH